MTGQSSSPGCYLRRSRSVIARSAATKQSTSPQRPTALDRRVGLRPLAMTTHQIGPDSPCPGGPQPGRYCRYSRKAPRGGKHFESIPIGMGSIALPPAPCGVYLTKNSVAIRSSVCSVYLYAPRTVRENKLNRSSRVAIAKATGQPNMAGYPTQPDGSTVCNRRHWRTGNRGVCSASDVGSGFKNVWPASSARGLSRLVADPVCFNVSGLEELPPAMMEIRTLRSS